MDFESGKNWIGKQGGVLYDVDQSGVCTITLNRPEALNAMNEGIMNGVCYALVKAASDPEAKVVILTGAGKGFCAGGDVKGMAAKGTPDGKPREPLPVDAGVWGLRTSMHTSELLRNMPKVTIAAINGACAGAGFSWACACDLRFAVKTAKFTTAFVNVGLSGDFGGTWTLPRIVGAAKARELYLLADVFMADEAKAINLVSEVFPDRDAMMQHVHAVSRKLSLRAPTALARIKANLNDADRLSFPEALNNESERHGRLGYSPENKIAATAFVNKTDPDFSKVIKKRAPWELSSL
jgi:2-(1,2-epoxy-1,2-dihydrophenyl)acetyl-CoA isomerase